MQLLKSRPDSKFSQQKLPTWQPIINVGTTWIIFIGVGVMFAIMGVGLVVILQEQAPETVVEYSGRNGCEGCQNLLRISTSCTACLTMGPSCRPRCNLKFTVDADHVLQLPVYVYYELDNFYQNHRSYISSRDDKQLLGLIFNEDKNGIVTPRKLSTDGCKHPFRTIGTKQYFPCGAIANSMFTDRFELKHTVHGTIKLNSTPKDIVWDLERKYKFKNPQHVTKSNYKKPSTNKRVKVFQENFIKPRNWTDDIYDEWWMDGGMQNPHFINWMHPAPISRFRKLYAVIREGCGVDKKFLCAGDYILEIEYRVQEDYFNGTKKVIFSTTTFLGTRKRFLSYFTLGFGLFCIIVGVIFYFLQKFMKVRVHPARRRRPTLAGASVPVVATGVQADVSPTKPIRQSIKVAPLETPK